MGVDPVTALALFGAVSGTAGLVSGGVSDAKQEEAAREGRRANERMGFAELSKTALNPFQMEALRSLIESPEVDPVKRAIQESRGLSTIEQQFKPQREAGMQGLIDRGLRGQAKRFGLDSDIRRAAATSEFTQALALQDEMAKRVRASEMAGAAGVIPRNELAASLGLASALPLFSDLSPEMLNILKNQFNGRGTLSSGPSGEILITPKFNGGMQRIAAQNPSHALFQPKALTLDQFRKAQNTQATNLLKKASPLETNIPTR